MNRNLLENAAVASGIELLSVWIEAQMAYKGQPGLSIGIVYDQTLVWSRGFGYADLETKREATPQTIYRIASITKLFTSTAILQLRDAGLLQLDDPISRHLSWFRMIEKHRDAPPITIRHLLTHTAGLPREVDFPYWDDGEFPTREAMRERLAEQETVLPTETQWKYSNLGLTLAGEVVQAVSGQPYVSYIRENILDPLEMGSTYVETLDPAHAQLATGYGKRLPAGTRQLSPFTDCRGITPAANMASTVADLARFAMLQFRDEPVGGKEILRGSSLREMQRVHWLNPDWSAGRGLGFYVWRKNNKTLAGHGGALQGYRTEFQVCPEDKAGVIVLTNADDGNPLFYIDKAFDWVIPPLVAAAKPKPEERQPDPAWQQYVGKYRNVWSDLQVLILSGELVLIDPSLPDPKLAVTKLLPVSTHTFRMESTNNFAAEGELALFEIDDAGQIVRLKLGSNYTYPISHW
jgi:CubicO group peptidase (beta-lactamase class C family)